MNTDMLLLEELWSVSSPSHYALVNGALTRVRFEKPGACNRGRQGGKSAFLLTYAQRCARVSNLAGNGNPFPVGETRDVDTHDSSALRVPEFDGNHPWYPYV